MVVFYYCSEARDHVLETGAVGEVVGEGRRRRRRTGARCSVCFIVFFFFPTAAATAVAVARTSQYVRAVAMPRSCLFSLWSLLCAVVCACAAVAAVPAVVSPPSFRSANLSAAALLATGRYGKTVLASDEMAVAVQEYADCAVFRVQARTRGYVALGFVDPIAAHSVDVLLLWVDDETGAGHLLVSCLARSMRCAADGRYTIPERRNGGMMTIGDDDDDDVWPVLEHQCCSGELAAAPPIRSAGNCL